MCWHRSKSRSPVHLNSVVIVDPLTNCSSPNGQWSSNWQVLRCCFYIFLHISTCFYIFLHISTCFYMFLHVSTSCNPNSWQCLADGNQQRKHHQEVHLCGKIYTVQPPGCGKCWDNQQKLRCNNMYIYYYIYIYTHVIYSNYIYKCYYVLYIIYIYNYIYTVYSPKPAECRTNQNWTWHEAAKKNSFCVYFRTRIPYLTYLSDATSLPVGAPWFLSN